MIASLSTASPSATPPSAETTAAGELEQVRKPLSEAEITNQVLTRERDRAWDDVAKLREKSAEMQQQHTTERTMLETLTAERDACKNESTRLAQQHADNKTERTKLETKFKTKLEHVTGEGCVALCAACHNAAGCTSASPDHLAIRIADRLQQHSA